MELKTEVLDTQQQQQPQLPPPPQQQHFHVLAVDDSIIDRKLLEKLLKVSSYQVTCVDSVDKALEYLGLDDNLDDDSTASSSSSSSSTSSTAVASSSSSSSSSQSSKQEMKELQVNMIMTDYCMPGMNGYDLLKRVKGSSWKDVPVVVMSSENVPSIINMCLEGGAEEFLLKPVQLSDLKKLQPRLLKSLGHSCKTIHNENVFNIVDNENENKNIFNIVGIENIFIVDNENENENIFNIVDNENEESNDEDSNSNGGKRKAMSPQPSERRHKLKGVALV